MFMLESSFGYFCGVSHSMAQAVDDPKQAKRFKTQDAAQKMLDKWLGTGVGIEPFRIVPAVEQ